MDTEIEAGFSIDTTDAKSSVERLEEQIKTLVQWFGRLEVASDGSVKSVGVLGNQLLKAHNTKDIQKQTAALAQLHKGYEKLLRLVSSYGSPLPLGKNLTQTPQADIALALQNYTRKQKLAAPQNLVASEAAFESSLRALQSKQQTAGYYSAVDRRNDLANQKLSMMYGTDENARLLADEQKRLWQNRREDLGNQRLIDAKQAMRQRGINQKIDKAQDLETYAAQTWINEAQKRITRFRGSEAGLRLSGNRLDRLEQSARPENIEAQMASYGARLEGLRLQNETPGYYSAVRQGKQEQINRTIELAQDTELRAAQRRLQTARDEDVKFRGSDQGMAVRQRAAERDRRRASDPGYIRGANVLDADREDYVRKVGQKGSTQAHWDKRFETLNHNGGADLLAIQSRIMVGYQALSMAFNTVRSFSTFIVQLDKEFAQFAAITNTTSGEMIQVRKDIIAVSEATKFSALEVAQAATILGQAGFSAQGVRESLEAITLLATASGSSLNESVETVTSTLSIFNLQADQATQIANTFTAALNGSKLSMDKITLGLQYAGNTAAQFGVTYQELTAVLGAMANSGIKSGSTLGTGLRQLLVDLEVPSKKFAAQLAAIGLSQSDVDVKSRGLVTVLRTLKEAGFGASEAYKAFEVRAAAAYSAVANNLDLTGKLEASFNQSTAALKANETQMEALANTWDKFYSVVGTALYTTFAPVLGVLKEIVDVAATMISTLNKIPGLLPAIGSIAAGFGSLAALGTAKSVFRGLAGGLPVLSTFTKGIAGATGAVGAFTGAWAGLTAVMAANPIGAIVGIGVAAFALYKAFNDGLTETERSVQLLDMMVSQSKQKMESLAQEVSAIDQTVTNLNDRKISLDADPLDRKLKIDEVLAQFNELNGTINSSTSSVQDLISALEDLRKIKLDEQIAELGRQGALAASQAQAENLNREREYNSEGTKRRSLGRIVYNLADVPDPNNPGFSWNNSSSTLYQQAMHRSQNYGARISAQFPQSGYGQREIQDILAAIVDPANAANITTLDASSKRISATKTDLDAKVANLTNEIQKAKSAGDKALATSLRTQLEEVKQLQGLINDLIDSSSGIVESAARTLEARKTQAQADLEKASSIKKGKAEADIALTVPAAVQQFNIDAQKLSDILSDNRTGLTDSEVAYDELVSKIEGLEKLRTDWIEDYIKRTGLPKGEVTALFDNSVAGQSLQEALQRTQAEADRQEETAGKGNERRAKQRLAAANEAVKFAKKAASKADGSAELIIAQRKLNEAFEQQDAAEQKNYDVRLAQIDNERDRQIAAEARAEERKNLLEARQQEMDAVEDRLTAARVKEFDTSINLMNKQIGDIEKDIDDATAELKKANDSTSASSWKAKLEALLGQLNNLVDIRANLVTERQAVSMGGGGSFYEKLIGSESGGRFGAVNQIGAGGRVQFMPARWNEIRSQIGMDDVSFQQMVKSPEIQKMAEQAHFADIQKFIAQSGLSNFFGSDINGTKMDMGAMLGIAHLGGKGGLSKYVLSGGRYNPADANGTKLSDYSKKFAGTNTDIDAYYNGPATLQAADDNRTTEEARKKADEAASDAELNILKTGAARANRTQEETLDSIAATAKRSQDPAQIKALIARADEIADNIMETKLGVYDAENPDNPEGRADLVKQLSLDRDQKISTLLDQYFRALDDATMKPVELAKRKLEEAQRPENAGKYSAMEINQLEVDLRAAETAAEASELEAAKQKLALTQKQLTEATKEYGSTSASATYWTEQLAIAEQKVAEIERNLGIQRTTAAKPPVDPIGGAAAGFVQSSKYWDSTTNNFKTPAVQAGEAWSETFATMEGGLTDFFMSWGDGFQSIGESAKAFGLTLVQMLMKATAQALAFKTVMALANGLQGTPLGGAVSNILGFMGGVGVPIPGSATGEIIEGGIPGRDSVLRRVEPGEAILRQSAVTMLGKDNVRRLNALGNRKLSEGTATALPTDKSSGTVNVWVVSPDQQPTMTESDIVATVSNNIANKGSLKHLIKSVQMGAV